jgi:hypothetical protein
LTGGWLSAILANSISNFLVPVKDSEGYQTTRNAYIALAVIAQIISIIIYLSYILNWDKASCCTKWDFRVLVII